MNNIKPYDWAADDGALKFDIPVDRGKCPKGHQCKRSGKYELLKYFLCLECNIDDYPEFNGKGIYYTEDRINIIFQYKKPVYGWYEIGL